MVYLAESTRESRDAEPRNCRRADELYKSLAPEEMALYRQENEQKAMELLDRAIEERDHGSQDLALYASPNRLFPSNIAFRCKRLTLPPAKSAKKFSGAAVIQRAPWQKF